MTNKAIILNVKDDPSISSYQLFKDLIATWHAIGKTKDKNQSKGVLLTSSTQKSRFP